MRYWMISILTALAGLTGAEEPAESWGEWDELPADVLDLGGEASAEQLSQRLDRLIQQNPESPEIDRLLALWLEQTAAAGTSAQGQPMSLQSLMGNTSPGQPEGSGPPGLQQRERLQQLLQGLPANPNATTGGSPPVELPSNNNSSPDPEIPTP